MRADALAVAGIVRAGTSGGDPVRHLGTLAELGRGVTRCVKGAGDPTRARPSAMTRASTGPVVQSEWNDAGRSRQAGASIMILTHL